MIAAPNLPIDIENDIRILEDDLVGILIKVMWTEAVKNTRSLASQGPRLISVDEDKVARLLRSVAETIQIVAN